MRTIKREKKIRYNWEENEEKRREANFYIYFIKFFFTLNAPASIWGICWKVGITNMGWCLYQDKDGNCDHGTDANKGDVCCPDLLKHYLFKIPKSEV